MDGNVNVDEVSILYLRFDRYLLLDFSEIFKEGHIALGEIMYIFASEHLVFI